MIIKEGINNLGRWRGSLSSSARLRRRCWNKLLQSQEYLPSLLRCCYPCKACISRAFLACDLVMLCGWKCVCILIIGDMDLGLMLLCVCLLCPAFSIVALCALAPDLIAVHSDWLPCARLWLLVADLTSLCIIIQVTVSYFKFNFWFERIAKYTVIPNLLFLVHLKRIYRVHLKKDLQGLPEKDLQGYLFSIIKANKGPTIQSV